MRNEVAPVTGASRGIDAGLARALAAAGARVAVAARTLPELRPLAAEIGRLTAPRDVASVSSIGAVLPVDGGWPGH